MTDGTHTAKIPPAGNDTAGSFPVLSGGHGGTGGPAAGSPIAMPMVPVGAHSG